MTMGPSQPPQPAHSLDAEERALAKALPRLHGRTAPGPDLDASILAAAQASVRPAKPSQFAARPRIRWIAPASLAASMVLAVGIAWQLRPLPPLESALPAAHSDSADIAAVQTIQPASYDEPAPMQMKPAPAQSAPTERPLVAPPIVSSQARSPAPEAQALQVPAPLPAASPSPPQVYAPPPAPPAPAAAMTAEAAPRTTPSAASSGNTLDTQVSDRAMRARTPTPVAAPSANYGAMAQEAASAIERTQQMTRKSAAPPPVMPDVRKEAQMAADAGFVDDPAQDVPPATVESPAVRDAWLHRINQLLEQGARQEAKASLTEFRRRYPSAVLPPKLRALEIEP